MTTKVLNVWWDSRVVGQFTQDRHGDIAFQYADEWLGDQTTPPLSASLPKRPEEFSRRECRPFFGGLLPEESQRLVAAQALAFRQAMTLRFSIVWVATLPARFSCCRKVTFRLM